MKLLLRGFIFMTTVFVIGFSIGYRDVRIITDTAAAFGISPKVALAIVQAESSGFSWAIGRGGERGAFQITETTWTALTDEPYREAFNLQTSARVAMRNLLDARTSDPRCLISYHNAGTTDWEGLNKRWTTNHPNRIYRAIYRGEIL